MCPRASVSVLNSGWLYSNTFQSKLSGLGKIKIFGDNIAARMNAPQYSANEDMTTVAGLQRVYQLSFDVSVSNYQNCLST